MIITAFNSRTWFIYAGISMLVSLVIYFAVLHDTNKTIDRTTNAVSQQIHDANLPKAEQRLADCILAAGSDLNKVQACQTKLGG